MGKSIHFMRLHIKTILITIQDVDPAKGGRPRAAMILLAVKKEVVYICHEGIPHQDS